MIKNRVKWFVFIFVALSVLSVALYALDYWNLLPRKHYTAEHFKIEIIKSSIDFNDNGVDDYMDIMLGARLDAENKPKYNGDYCEGGYPPEDIGVCTDLVWRAFKHAGYNLRAMMDNDIKENITLYTRITTGKSDSNIDFRRVPNQKVFFERYAVSLTIDVTKIEEWQPGDIVTYGTKHIAIISDKRNKDGIPYIIHNGGQPNREEDAISRLEISGHFRFDASRIEKSKLVAF